LVLLRIRPYNERVFRYLVFNTRSKTVVRLDGIGLACRALPDEAGIVFPGGYHLATGTTRLFDTAPVDDDLELDRVVTSATGEDVLYVFRSRTGGGSLLLSYNVIRQAVSTPLRCDGYALFDDGTLLLHRAAADGPARVHPVQVWQTPYVSDLHAAEQAAAAHPATHGAHPDQAGSLHRVGNVELVRGVADCLS
nr:DNA repair ATPase [Micromonospora sp. DSM 115978]